LWPYSEYPVVSSAGSLSLLCNSDVPLSRHTQHTVELAATSRLLVDGLAQLIYEQDIVTAIQIYADRGSTTSMYSTGRNQMPHSAPCVKQSQIPIMLVTN
jgi:hypothetical protein